MAEIAIDSIIERIKKEHINVFSITKYDKGKVENHDFINNPQPSNIYSLSKNITSLAIGILIDRGKLFLDQYISSIFQNDYSPILLQPYSKVTVKDVLTQVTGIEKDFLDTDADPISSFPDKDFLVTVFKTGTIYPPGKVFVYSDSNYYLLGRVIEKVTHHKGQKFIINEIFKPLGITDYSFKVDPLNNYLGATGIYLTSKDINLLGQLFLNNGIFQGRRIVSGDYLDIATSKIVKVDKTTFYGLSIWSKKSTSFYYGNGMNGQLMLIDKVNQQVITYLSEESPSTAYSLEKALLDMLEKVQKGRLKNSLKNCFDSF